MSWECQVQRIISVSTTEMMTNDKTENLLSVESDTLTANRGVFFVAKKKAARHKGLPT